ncbi:MAG: hypothetical protein HKO67_05745 [Flavobacteriaceae bacterium]|nr:hypothetical protein [Flavobacteriaceae bacterium]
MKKITISALLFFMVSGGLIAQQEKGIIGYDNWLNPWTEFRPNKVEYGTPTQILSGSISSDTHLFKKETYLLIGDVFVTDSTTLTIEPGTVIMGDFKTKGSLTISRGSKILAEGLATDPIIFTSNRSVKKPGDWGGLFILGDAPTSKFGNEGSINYGLRPSNASNLNYGGNNPESDSGVFKFVRIEYAGKRTRDFGYFSGLTLAGIGSKTTINNVMVSYCEGISFNILGGSLSLDQMVSYRSSIDDYKFNFGTQCEITNSLAVRSPYVSGAQTSRSLHIVAYNKADDADFSKKQTAVSAQNLTLINISDNLNQDIKVGLVNEAIFIGNHAAFAIDKSVISGYNPAVILDENIRINDENLSNLKFTNTYFNNCNGNIFRKGYFNNDDLESYYGSRAFNNVYSKGPDSETFIDIKDGKRPDFRLRINRIIASSDD